MNKFPFSLLALLSIASILTGGCTLYTNPSACEAQMRQTAGAAEPPSTLSIAHVGVGIDGSRVVVEGTLKTATASPATASSPATPPPVTAPATKAAVAECTFDGKTLTTLHWLTPPEFANPPTPAATDG